MSTIGGPGGIGGPKGPTGPEATQSAQGTDDVADVGETQATVAPSATGATGASDIDAIAADVAAGRLSPREAVDRLVDQIAGTEHLGAADRAELRDMLQDLVANDPYLTSLIGRI